MNGIESAEDRLPLLCEVEERGGERRRLTFYHPSLRLSPHSFLAGREGSEVAAFNNGNHPNQRSKGLHHPPMIKTSCTVMLLVKPCLNALARRIVGPVTLMGFS